MTFKPRKWEFDPLYADSFADNFRNKNVDVCISFFFQTERWWEHCIPSVIEKMKFKQKYIDEIRNKYSKSFEKNTIAISVRRGDFVGHNCFFQIPKDYYLSALLEHFPNWQDYNLIFFSDDIDWCKSNFSGDNLYFAETNNTHTGHGYHNDPMDQLIYASQCDNAILSNSTFSWWIGYYISAIYGKRNTNEIKNILDNKPYIYGSANDSLSPLTDKFSGHAYQGIYEELLLSKKTTAKNILEIGVEFGGSMLFLKDYFINADIYGVDIIPAPDNISEEKNIHYINHDAYNHDFIRSLSNKKFDIIIDDGPHTLESMKFFAAFYPSLLKEDGMMIIEDIPDQNWTHIIKACFPKNLQPNVKIIDLRHINNRLDDIIMVLQMVEHNKVVHSPYNFAGNYAAMYDIRDFYPKYWHTFDHHNKQVLSELGYFEDYTEMYRVPFFCENDIIVDIGAHIGHFSLTACKRGAKKVIGFEPSIKSFNQAVLNTRSQSDKVKIRHMAVWRSDINEGITYKSSKDGHMDLCLIRGGGDTLVETTSLDEILKDIEKVRFLKINCEGSEYPILLTSKLLFDKVEEIAAELHRYPIEQILLKIPENEILLNGWNWRLTPEGLVDYIKSIGYQVEHIFISDPNLSFLYAKKSSFQLVPPKFPV
jgi:FkbM family methyltransferase